MSNQNTTEENRSLIRKVYEDFSRGDVAAVLSALSPKVEWTDAEGFPYAGTNIGPEAIKENVFMRIGTEWDRFEARASDYIADEDQVVVIGEYHCIYKATGKSVEAPFAHLWQVENGKVTRYRQFTDAPPFQRAVEK